MDSQQLQGVWADSARLGMQQSAADSSTDSLQMHRVGPAWA